MGKPEKGIKKQEHIILISGGWFLYSTTTTNESVANVRKYGMCT